MLASFGGAGIARAQSVTIIDGAVDPIDLDTGERGERWFRVSVDSDRLVLLANGPTVLSIRLRAVHPRRAQGTLRIVRDYGPFSDTPYDLERDPDRTLPPEAQAERNAVSRERVLHVRVPEGEHTYAMAPVRGPPLLLRVLRTSRYDPSLAPPAERAVAVAAAVERPAPRVPESPTIESPPPEAPTLPRPPRRPPELEVAPVRVAPSDAEVTALLPTRLGSTVDERALPRPPRLSGPALALYAGAGALLDAMGDGRESTHLAFGRGYVATTSLELAWDLDPTVSLFVSGGFGFGEASTSGPEGGPSVLGQRVMPFMAGLTFRMPLGEHFRLRLRLGGGGALVNAIPADTAIRQLLPLGGVAGLAGEYALGPGAVALEARYLLLRGEWFAPMVRPWPFPAETGEAGGPQLLVGYRLEL